MKKIKNKICPNFGMMKTQNKHQPKEGTDYHRRTISNILQLLILSFYAIFYFQMRPDFIDYI